MIKIINAYSGRVYASLKDVKSARSFMKKKSLIKVDDSKGQRGRAIYVYNTKTAY